MEFGHHRATNEIENECFNNLITLTASAARQLPKLPRKKVRVRPIYDAFERCSIHGWYFPETTLQTCRLLDAGAGVGALSCAFLDRWLSGGFCFETVEATAYEVGETLREHLTQHLASHSKVKAEVEALRFTHAHDCDHCSVWQDHC